MKQKKVMHWRYRDQMGLSSSYFYQRSQQFDCKIKVREKFKSEEPIFNDFAIVVNDKNTVLISKDQLQASCEYYRSGDQGFEKSNPNFMIIIEPERNYKS
jgi:hypothetical protein